MGWLTSEAVGEKVKTFCGVVMLIGMVCYGGWLLVDDLASYGYEPARATETRMAVKPGSSKNGDLIEVGYTYTVDGKTYTGENLFGPAASQRAHYFATETFTGWYADWSKDPVVYHDASDPERSRMVVGLTSSMGVVFLPAVMLAGSLGWMFIGGKASDAKASEFQRLDTFTYRLHVMGWGVGAFLLTALAGQSIYFTKLWVEQGWMLHAGVSLGTAAGLAIGFWRAQVARRENREMEAEFARRDAFFLAQMSEEDRMEAERATRRR